MTPDLHELLARYADGELSAEDRARVEAELAASADAAAELERWRSLRLAAHRALCDVELPAGVADRIARRVATDRGFAGTRTYRIASFLAVAAAIVLFVVFRSGGPLGRRPGVVQAGAVFGPAAYVDVFENCAKHHHAGVKLEGSCPIAAREAVGRVCGDYRVAVPDLRPIGYELCGICQCFGGGCKEGVRGVHAYYQRSGAPDDLISVFSTSACVKFQGCDKIECRQTKRTYELATVRTVTVVRWDESGGHFALVGEKNPKDLEKLAESVQIAAATGR
ncbi:MAG: zf-HC2 domain-containing protein [Planctomycetes bacterium]|nr:zf-HC2 domain-containing protein [Planctomycetota bacterium]